MLRGRCEEYRWAYLLLQEHNNTEALYIVLIRSVASPEEGVVVLEGGEVHIVRVFKLVLASAETGE